MGERRKTKAIKGEFHLPEPIIHRIQSFLTEKEAAQTTILSKSWHSAWLTRPNLYIDEGDFIPVFSISDSHSSYDSDSDDSISSSDSDSDDSVSSSDSDSDRDCCYSVSKKEEFLKFAKKTIQRYEQSNLKIERLRLRIRRSYNGSNSARDLIVRALRIGVTHLSLKLGRKVLPCEVFESGNIVELSVEGGRIDLKMDQKVTCPKLESLSLSKSKIKREVIFEIISSCPSIKNLLLSRIRGFDYQIVRLINLPKSHERVRRLVLCRVKFGTSFLSDLSSKIPSLQDLTLDSCGNVQEICSRSLLRLTLIAQGNLKVKFDVPSMQKFSFEGSNFPSMCFKTTSREWESHVSINYKKPLGILWFNGLKRILTHLERSKIYLTLGLPSRKSLIYQPEDIHGLPKRQVENVTMDLSKLSSLICRALFDGLFRLCVPKEITPKWYPEKTRTCKITNIDFLCKTLVRGMNGEFSSPSNFMHGVHGLEEVNMELYDEDVAAWRPRPLESLLDGSLRPKEKQNVRFQLKWKQ